MSVSTDAILYYGIELGETFATDWYELSEQWQKAHAPQCPKDKSDYKTPEWNTWRKAKAEWEATPENIRIDTHCHFDYSMYFASVHRHYRKAYRGDPLEIDPATLVATDEDRAMLKKFLEWAHVPYTGEPKWTLCSYWG